MISRRALVLAILAFIGSVGGAYLAATLQKPSLTTTPPPQASRQGP
jgi:hypothetical protein